MRQSLLILLLLLFMQVLSLFSARAEAKPLVIAVIDTGIDRGHEKLKPFLWINTGESGLDLAGQDKASNGIDDDLNGYIDDINGWNFAVGNTRIHDDHGHGTHISGLITRDLRPEKIKVMTLKYFDPTQPDVDTLAGFIESIEYALKMGADVINISGGGVTFSAHELMALKKLEERGIPVCAASGNNSKDVAVLPFYPASYELNNLISVAASAPESTLLPSSNYGMKIDFASPGLEQVSTLPTGSTGVMTGSSQATANLCNTVAFLLLENPGLSPLAIRSKLSQTGEWHQALHRRIATGVIPSRERLVSMRGVDQDVLGNSLRLPEEVRERFIYRGNAN